jgi:hypothetical protein
MNEGTEGQWEERVRAIAGAFPYPQTPDMAAGVPQRSKPLRLAWSAAATFILLALLTGLLAVPRIRAAMVELLNLGAIRILLGEPTPTPASTPAGVAPTTLPSLLDLAGETTLAEARAQAGFPLRVPTYPPNLGPPDRVFLQRLCGPVVVLVWLDREQPERVNLSLHQLGVDTFGEKVQPPVVEETTVGGQLALWTEGPYLLQVWNGDAVLRRLVEGHVLVWVEDEITYRLETDLNLEEAIRIAESLQ